MDSKPAPQHQECSTTGCYGLGIQHAWPQREDAAGISACHVYQHITIHFIDVVCPDIQRHQPTNIRPRIDIPVQYAVFSRYITQQQLYDHFGTCHL